MKKDINMHRLGTYIIPIALILIVTIYGFARDKSGAITVTAATDETHLGVVTSTNDRNAFISLSDIQSAELLEALPDEEIPEDSVLLTDGVERYILVRYTDGVLLFSGSSNRNTTAIYEELQGKLKELAAES